VYKTEKNFRIHIWIGIVVILFGLYWPLDKYLWSILLIVIAMVLSLEILNSAIERLVDMLTPQTHKFAKEIKDLLAAMVLVVAIFAIITGILIFFW
jgi:diacylglycerol kinase